MGCVAMVVLDLLGYRQDTVTVLSFKKTNLPNPHKICTFTIFLWRVPNLKVVYSTAFLCVDRCTECLIWLRFYSKNVVGFLLDFRDSMSVGRY